MPQLVLSRGNRYKRGIIRRFFPKFEASPYFLIVSLVVFVALITVITLVFSARQVTKGYVLNSLESTHQELIRESEEKDMQISKVRSLNYIQNSSKVNSMREPNAVVFVNGETAIAKK
ncbi:hypothetical protein GF366_00375 [Candidatus Peregrinibacteria bacterium]|nr:hypothetical protein [Candidatus Peregrinibacteria bacterium]